MAAPESVTPWWEILRSIEPILIPVVAGLTMLLVKTRDAVRDLTHWKCDVAVPRIDENAKRILELERYLWGVKHHERDE